MSNDLTRRRVLVTGASSGIGAEVCRAIVGRGGSVAMLARRKERLDELHTVLGERAIPVPADVTDLDALDGAVAEAAQRLDGLDGLIAVAGRSMAGGIATGTPERWRELIELNLVAPLATARLAISHFAGDGRRDVVFVGSTAAITAMPSVGIYGASKRGLKAAYESLRFELAPQGINTSYVMPGMFETEGLTIEGMVIDGDVPPNDFPLLTPGTVPADPAVLAEIVAFMIGLPDGVCDQRARGPTDRSAQPLIGGVMSPARPAARSRGAQLEGTRGTGVADHVVGREHHLVHRAGAGGPIRPRCGAHPALWPSAISFSSWPS